MPQRRACSGSSGMNGWTSSSREPESARYAPLRIFINVLLPAPFSPMSAWTSPGATAKETPFNARVAPKDFRTPDMRRPEGMGAGSLQILLQRRIQQLLDRRLLHVLGRHQDHAGVDAFLDFFALQMLDHRHHAPVAHVDGVLDHEPLHIAVFEI